MVEREPQFVSMSRQGILVATAMGVGLVTFSYVIGVQVGKRSLTHNSNKPLTLDDELRELPEPLDVQLNIFKSLEGNVSSVAGGQTQAKPSRAIAAPAPWTQAETSKPVARAERFTAQISAFKDIDTARRAAEKLRSEGYAAKIISADGLHRVQLDWSLPRADLDARLPHLRTLGYNPTPVKRQ